MCTYFFQFFFEVRDALANGTLVHFQLCFTRTAQTHTPGRASTSATATSLSFQMRPLTREPRQIVFILREFHLQHAFTSMRVLSKNIENKRSAIQHADVSAQLFLQFALMARRKFIVEDHNL